MASIPLQALGDADDVHDEVVVRHASRLRALGRKANSCFLQIWSDKDERCRELRQCGVLYRSLTTQTGQPELSQESGSDNEDAKVRPKLRCLCSMPPA